MLHMRVHTTWLHMRQAVAQVATAQLRSPCSCPLLTGYVLPQTEAEQISKEPHCGTHQHARVRVRAIQHRYVR